MVDPSLDADHITITVGCRLVAGDYTLFLALGTAICVNGYDQDYKLGSSTNGINLYRQCGLRVTGRRCYTSTERDRGGPFLHYHPPQMASGSGQIAPTTHNHPLFTNGDALTVESPTFNMNPSVISPLSVPVHVPARHTGEGLNSSQTLGTSRCVLRSVLGQSFTRQ